MYQQVIDTLATAGFEHYEISAWARRDREQGPSRWRSQHNLLYWYNGNWLGVGPSAASHMAGHRWKNEPHLGRYLAGRAEPPTQDHEHLPRDQRLGEALMMGLRVRDGLERAWLDSMLADDPARQQRIEQLYAQGLLERTPTHLRLSDRGLMVADAVVAQLL